VVEEAERGWCPMELAVAPAEAGVGGEHEALGLVWWDTEEDELNEVFGQITLYNSPIHHHQQECLAPPPREGGRCWVLCRR
jgi:hypothetical protein